MKKNLILFLILIFFTEKNVSAQGKFDIVSNRKCITVPFELVNNLILIPIELNGKEMIFILDTGVSKSLLFNVVELDAIPLNKKEKIRIKGLGEDKYFDAIKSKKNLFRIDKIINPNFEIYIILDFMFDFSTRLGTNVNGLIGTDLLKDFIVEINYIKKKITFTKHENYRFKKIDKCKKCKTVDLFFQNQKPYLKTLVSDEKDVKIPVTLLIDSGSGDSVWLFESDNQDIEAPKKFIREYLGKGLSGNIYGKKAKMSNFYLGDYNFKNIITAYPDSTSYFLLNKSIRRNGSIGAEILRRFHIIFDYKNKKMYLKENANFKSPFFYDKSGLEIIYNGKMLVKEEDLMPTYGSNEDKGAVITLQYRYVFKNSYKISLVKPNSPAEIAGLKVDDVVLEVNGKPAYEFKLNKLISVFSKEDGEIIKLYVDRNGFKYNFVFKLKDML